MLNVQFLWEWWSSIKTPWHIAGLMLSDNMLMYSNICLWICWWLLWFSITVCLDQAAPCDDASLFTIAGGHLWTFSASHKTAEGHFGTLFAMICLHDRKIRTELITALCRTIEFQSDSISDKAFQTPKDLREKNLCWVISLVFTWDTDWHLNPD
jgi:hypothetical protein